MSDLKELISDWRESTLALREVEKLVGLLVLENAQLVVENVQLEKKLQGVAHPMSIISVLQEVVDTATMRGFSCDFPAVRVDTTPAGLEKTLVHPTKYIKEKTHLWRKTWIISPLKGVIEQMLGSEHGS